MKFSTSLAAAVFVFSAGMASASSVTFQGSFEVTEFNSSDPGLKVYVSPTTGDFGPVDLMPGEYTDYGYLFSIWTDEKAINDDDRDPKDISVELTFSSPITDGSIGGSTVGVGWGSFGLGYLSWDDPVTFAFGPGGSGEFKVFLTNTKFLLSTDCWWKCDGSKVYKADVYGKIKYTEEPNVIPLPAAGWLLLAGLGGLAAVGRKKRWA